MTTVARKSKETLTQIRARVLREVGDPDGDRWNSDSNYTDVDEAVNNQLMEMGTHMAADFPGEALLRTTITYNESSAPVSLGSTIESEAVYKVEDISTENLPIVLEYISPLELEDYDPGEVFGSYYRFRYSLFGPSGTDPHAHRIQLYPKANTSLSLRVSYIGKPFIMGSASDHSPLSPRWVELVSLGAAIKLLRRDEEATQQQYIAYGKLWEQFTQFSQRQRGPKRVRRRRRGM
tara:strand:- start:5612 stop:6316 length:705 start_codon:yes stop_codon:yes gene_type:complete